MRWDGIVNTRRLQRWEDQWSEKMKAIILAAGYATRLYPLTQNFPKPLLDVGGKPILDWLIEDLDGVIDEFAVVTNHRFAPHFEAWAEGKPVRVIDDGTMTNETRLGAVRDIRLAFEVLSGKNAESREDAALRAAGADDHAPEGAGSGNMDDEAYLVMAGDNVLTFSLVPFVAFGREKKTGCVMCHVENDLEKARRTGIITVDENSRITSYQEKPAEPKGNLAVPPFYYYRAQDLRRIDEALAAGCGYDAPGSFAVWLSGMTDMHAWMMPGGRYDIGDMRSYEAVKEIYHGPTV